MSRTHSPSKRDGNHAEVVPHESLYSFNVSGNPIPKARPRLSHGHAYTPETTKAWENLVRLSYGGPKFIGELAITMRFFRGNRRACDWDNLAKAVQDALNGIAWNDDSQIIEATIFKSYDKTNPRVEVEIELLLLPF